MIKFDGVEKMELIGRFKSNTAKRLFMDAIKGRPMDQHKWELYNIYSQVTFRELQMMDIEDQYLSKMALYNEMIGVLFYWDDPDFLKQFEEEFRADYLLQLPPQMMRRFNFIKRCCYRQRCQRLAPAQKAAFALVFFASRLMRSRKLKSNSKADGVRKDSQ